MWHVYKCWIPGRSEEIYKVGRKKEGSKEIEWNGFYSREKEDCFKFARELNRKEAEDGKDK